MFPQNNSETSGSFCLIQRASYEPLHELATIESLHAGAGGGGRAATALRLQPTVVWLSD
jgi:hypothetical protein